MLAQMEAVVDHFDSGQLGACGTGKGRPPIKRDDLDGLFLGRAQGLLEKRGGGFGRAMLNDFQHRAVLSVTQDTDVVMSGVEALFIYHQVGNGALLIAATESALDGTLLEIPHLVRRQAQ